MYRKYEVENKRMQRALDKETSTVMRMEVPGFGLRIHYHFEEKPIGRYFIVPCRCMGKVKNALGRKKILRGYGPGTYYNQQDNHKYNLMMRHIIC